MNPSPTMPPSTLTTTSKELVPTQWPDTVSISKLPNELLAEIFILSAPDTFMIPWQPGESNDLPRTLLHVSTKWRSIALRSPKLWSNISINYEIEGSLGGERLSPEFITRIACEILSRSGNVPLFLRIDATSYDSATEDWSHLVDLFTLYSDRIYYLHLYVDEEILSEVLESPPYDFKCLEFLFLESSEDTECVQEVPEVFQKAQRLRIAELDLSFASSLATPDFVWANLTHLSITAGNTHYNLPPNIAHRAIRQCPSLITLQIRLWPDDSPTDSYVPPMKLLSLRTLLVQLDGCATMAEFLNSLVLPCLTRLELTPSEYSPYGQDWDYIASLSAIPNYQSLEYLRIALPIPDGYNMEPIFKSTSNLIELQLPPLSHSTLLLLSSGKWLPKLQVLEVLVTLESLNAHVVMLNNRAEGGFSTEGILIWSTRKDRKKFKTITSSKEGPLALVTKLKNRGLLRLTSQERQYAEMRDFVPTHLRA